MLGFSAFCPFIFFVNILFFSRLFNSANLLKFRNLLNFDWVKFRFSDSANELKSPLQFCQHFDSVNLLKFGSLFFRKRLKFHVNICQIPIFYKLKFQSKLWIWNGISALNPTCLCIICAVRKSDGFSASYKLCYVVVCFNFCLNIAINYTRLKFVIH